MSSFLGEVHFVDIPIPGRVRCLETGHEMPIADKESYGSSKKCRRALFDLCLVQKRPPLNLFEQSPTCRDKVICKITGDLLNKTEEAIWKHMNGKKFQRKLSQSEVEKGTNVQSKVDITMDVQVQKGARAMEDNQSDGFDGDNESMDLEEPEFWIPPKDDMVIKGSDEDFDIANGSSLGIKRMQSKLHGRPPIQSKKKKIKAV